MEDINHYLKDLPNMDFDEKIIQTSISINTLALLIHRAVDISVEKKLTDILENFTDSKEDRLLSIEEASNFFGVSIVTIHAWKKKGLLKGFKRMGARVYIYESDCIACMKEIKISKK
ncbi:MAG: helix-turn-helix domain-containing protein [Cyclobacteriaceae bacterium]